MSFNFNTDRSTLIIAPVDMRAGYERLSLIAVGLFGIDVDAGKDFVIFISRPRKMELGAETGILNPTEKKS